MEDYYFLNNATCMKRPKHLSSSDMQDETSVKKYSLKNCVVEPYGSNGIGLALFNVHTTNLTDGIWKLGHKVVVAAVGNKKEETACSGSRNDATASIVHKSCICSTHTQKTFLKIVIQS